MHLLMMANNNNNKKWYTTKMHKNRGTNAQYLEL